MNTIDKFDGDYRFLSNFWPITISYQGYNYPSVEHAYQAAKTVNEQERAVIRKAQTPSIAKKLGRKIKIRPDWESIKFDLMLEFLKQKFANPELKAKLLETKDSNLVEGNYWHDQVFGVCSCSKCNNMGQNKLGVMLMQIRDELIRES